MELMSVENKLKASLSVRTNFVYIMFSLTRTQRPNMSSSGSNFHSSSLHLHSATIVNTRISITHLHHKFRRHPLNAIENMTIYTKINRILIYTFINLNTYSYSIFNKQINIYKISGFFYKNQC